MQAAVAWEAGIKVVAPIKEEGAIFEHLKQRGEGNMSLVFGVDDLDTACGRAKDAGLNVGGEIGLLGDEPWADQFSLIREARLETIFGATILLGQVEPNS